MKRLFLASLVSATLIGCGGSDGGSKPMVEPEKPLPAVPCEEGVDCTEDDMGSVFPPLVLDPANTAPVVENVPEITINYSESLTYQLQITDDHSEQFHYTLIDGPRFVSVNKDGLIYINPENEIGWVGTHKFKIIVSDGSMETETNEIIIKVGVPMTDLDPSTPVFPPTSDCGSSGECLEDDFEVNEVEIKIRELGLPEENTQTILEVCGFYKLNCGIDTDNGMFFLNSYGTRFYPESKTFSTSVILKESTIGYQYEIGGSKFTWHSDSSVEKDYVIKIFSDDNYDYAIAMMAFDSIKFYNMVENSKGGMGFMSGRVGIKAVAGNIQVEEDFYFNPSFNASEMVVALQALSPIYGGDEGYYEALAKREEVDVQSFVEACSYDYFCYGQVGGATHLSTEGYEYILDGKDSKIRPVFVIEVPEEIHIEQEILSARTTLSFDDESWVEVFWQHVDPTGLNDFPAYTVYPLITPTSEFINGITNDNPIQAQVTLSYNDWSMDFNETAVIRVDSMWDALIKNINQ